MTDIQIESMVTITGAEYEALRADNERLRAALQDIIADSFSVYAIQVARAVLEAQPAQTQEEA